MQGSVFSSQLMKYRKQKGLTQEALANRLNVTPQAVSKWEKGGYPDGELLPEIARTLDVSLDVLFGLKTEEENSVASALTDAIQELPESEKSDFCMNVFYTLLSAYSNIYSGETGMPETLLRETYAELKTDYELALARLNEDMRYCCFLKIPEKGIDSYAEINDRLLQFFRLLSRREALQIIFFFAGVERNHFWSVEQIASSLHISINVVSDVLQELDRLGAVWEVKVELGSGMRSVYGYTHSVPLEMILVLGTSFIHYISNTDPHIETWSKGAFRNAHDTK